MDIGFVSEFRNGLSVRVDWLSFTIKDCTEPFDVIDMLGYSSNDFLALSHGRNGYKSAYACRICDGLSILFDGNDGMGVHADISGGAIENVLKHYHDKRLFDVPFGGSAYEADRDNSTVLTDLLREICVSGKITRLDLAIDDIGAEHFTMSELQELLETGSCVSRFKEYRQDISKTFGGSVTGNTLYLGSRKSLCMLRIYDKKLEQNSKFGHAEEKQITYDWVRWELELKDERAMSASSILCSGVPLGNVVIGILSNYVRFIEHDNERRCRCSTLKKWEKFISGVSGLKLYQRPEPKTISDKKEWLKYGVSKSLAAVVMADGGDMTFLYDLLTLGSEKMDNATLKMVHDYLCRQGMR